MSINTITRDESSLLLGLTGNLRDERVNSFFLNPSGQTTRAGRGEGRGHIRLPCQAAIWLGCLVVSAIAWATEASAHVKWFVTCNASDDPLPPAAVFTPTFWLFAALFVTVLFVGCAIEDT
jgi:hypothetical protein